MNPSGIDLRGVDLAGEVLNAANLSEVDLTAATLKAATLSRTNLVGSNLMFADFRGANFDGTDLSGALLGWNTFGENDLASVKGLDQARHGGPSIIGIDTIYLSKGNIPEAFLRGAGVPDDFITYMRSLVGKAIEFYSCFISYSSKDQEFADRLYADLQQKGVRRWFAPEDLKIGDKFRRRIDESIRFYDKLLLVLSQDSIESPWVEKEVETAFEKEHKEKRLVLFPIRLDDAVMEAKYAWAADIRRTRHIGDFRRWKEHDHYQKAFNRLLRDLKAEAAQPQEKPASAS